MNISTCAFMHLFGAHRVLRVLGPDHPVAPLEELVPVFLRNTDHLGDHLERHLGGDVDDEVALAGLDHVVEDLVGELADVRLDHAHLAGREAAVHELAVARVLGRVHREHEVAALLELVVLGPALELHDAAALLVGGVRGAVAADRDDVGVLGDHPEAGPAGLGVEVHGRFVAQVREPLVRDALGEPVPVEQVDVAQLHSVLPGASDGRPEPSEPGSPPPRGRRATKSCKAAAHGRLRSAVHDPRDAPLPARSDPRGRAGAHPRRRDPRAERREHAELAVHAGRRPGRAGASRTDLPRVHRAALGDDLQGPPRGRERGPRRTRATRRCSRCSDRRSTSPTTSRSIRCCCSASCSSTRAGGSIFPATWSAMLAARAEGVGASLTSVFFFQLDDGARDPRRAEGGGLAVLVVRDVRLPDRTLGRRAAAPGARSRVPQPLGRTARLRDPRTALARRPNA